MSLEFYRNEILKRFKRKDVIEYSLGQFDGSSWEQLTSEVQQWWKFYKEWEAQDTVAKAFQEQRLTVKGTSTMDIPIQANDERGPKSTFDKPMQKMTGPLARVSQVAKPEQYRIKKTNESIMDRLKPKNFVPPKGGASQKTELGLHDLSAGLMNPLERISAQQYKTPGPNQTYVFMPLSHAGDQAVFQNINMLAKAYREQQSAFYTLVREIRSKMTRVKLAAEHDLASNFVFTGRTALGRPKFKLSLIEKTDVSVRDQKKGLVAPDVEFKSKEGQDVKVVQVATTPGILEARQHAALNFQSLVLGEMLRYGEVVIAYRQHAGDFPKFAQYDTSNSVWVVGTIGGSRGWSKKSPQETIPDKPA